MQMRLKTKNFHVAFFGNYYQYEQMSYWYKILFAQAGADVLTVRET